MEDYFEPELSPIEEEDDEEEVEGDGDNGSSMKKESLKLTNLNRLGSNSGSLVEAAPAGTMGWELPTTAVDEEGVLLTDLDFCSVEDGVTDFVDLSLGDDDVFVSLENENEDDPQNVKLENFLSINVDKLHQCKQQQQLVLPRKRKISAEISKRMSFLESTTNPDSQSRIIVREFKDPFCFSSPSSIDNNNSNHKSNLLPSRNKWSSSSSESDLKRRSTLNSSTDLNHVSSTTNSTHIVTNHKKTSVNRKSSCTISFDELHSGKDEISAINEQDKPLLRLWAQKNKTNAAYSNNSNRNNSYLGPSNDSKRILNQISKTPWGKYLKNNNSESAMTSKTETRKSDDIVITTQAVKKDSSPSPSQNKTETRPKSAYYERNFSLPNGDCSDYIYDNQHTSAASRDNKMASVTDRSRDGESTKRSSRIFVRSRSVNNEASSPTTSTSSSSSDEYHQEKQDSTKRKESARKQNSSSSNNDRTFKNDLKTSNSTKDFTATDAKPPPVPKRSTSRSKELVGYIRKHRDEQDASITSPNSNRAGYLSNDVVAVVFTSCDATSTTLSSAAMSSSGKSTTVTTTITTITTSTPTATSTNTKVNNNTSRETRSTGPNEGYDKDESKNIAEDSISCPLPSLTTSRRKNENNTAIFDLHMDEKDVLVSNDETLSGRPNYNINRTSRKDNLFDRDDSDVDVDVDEQDGARNRVPLTNCHINNPNNSTHTHYTVNSSFTSSSQIMNIDDNNTIITDIDNKKTTANFSDDKSRDENNNLTTTTATTQPRYQKRDKSLNFSRKVRLQKARSLSAFEFSDYLNTKDTTKPAAVNNNNNKDNKYNRQTKYTPEDRRRSVDFSRLVSATPWKSNLHNNTSSSSAITTGKEGGEKVGETIHGDIERKQQLQQKKYNPQQRHEREIIIPQTEFVRKQVDIDITEPAACLTNNRNHARNADDISSSFLLRQRNEKTNFNNNSNNPYTDIESQITGIHLSQQDQQQHNKAGNSLVSTSLVDTPVGGGGLVASLRNKEKVAFVPPRRSKSQPVLYFENETKTNIFSTEVMVTEQPCDAESHKQILYSSIQLNGTSFCNDNIVNGDDIDSIREMGSKYYTSNGHSLNSHYDRQQDSIFKTSSSLSTNLSRHNNESANMSDKYSRRNSSFGSNEQPSVHKNRYERSYSLNEDYSRPISIKTSRRTTTRRVSEDISSSLVPSSYVPKSAYLRQRLLELKSVDKPSKDNQRRRDREDSLSSEDSHSSLGTFRKNSLKNEDKIDVFIRNHKERRSSERGHSNSSSSSSFHSTSPPYSPVKIVKPNKTTRSVIDNSPSSSKNTISPSINESSTTAIEEEVFCNIPENLSDRLSKTCQEILEQHQYKKLTSPPPDTLENSKNPIQEDDTVFEENSSLHHHQDSVKENSTEMESVFGRRGSLKDMKDAVVRRFASSNSESKKSSKEKDEEILTDIQESPFDKLLVMPKGSSSEKEKEELPGKSTATVKVTTKNRFGKEKSTFGSITRITSSKISAASDLKGFSIRKKAKAESKQQQQKQEETNSVNQPIAVSDPKADETNASTSAVPTSPDNETKHKSFSRFSLKKKKSVDPAAGTNAATSATPSSPKQEPKHGRKHSLTSVFHKRKDHKDESAQASVPTPTSPTLNDAGAPVTSPTHNKERRGSAFSRLFSHKKQTDSSSVESTKTDNDKNTPKKKTSTVVESKVAIESSLVKESSNDTAVVKDDSLDVPSSKGLTASSESLCSDNDYGEPTTRRTSRNKERIRNRKLAKREAAERHKSLPAGIGELEIDMEKGMAVPVVNKINNNNNDNTTVNGESPSVTDATPRTRKKHRARRANTEFLGNVPLIAVQQASPMMSKDDDSVNRRAAGRKNRRDRAKTLTNGIDSDEIFGSGGQSNGDGGGGNDGVVNENMSFADIKKKLLEGLTDDKKIPEKVSQKERQKIKRTKSTKRYKTITEGIAPRDLELARQAIQAAEKAQDNGDGTSRNTIDQDTLAQITAALTSTGDKRKSFIVESRPASRYHSDEDLRISDDDEASKSKDDSILQPLQPSKRMLQRTKSMTALHLDDKTEIDPDEPEIKPLSELKNRFLQAMEDTKQKHLQHKKASASPVEVRRRGRRDRKDRPHTICGIDAFTMDQLQDDISAGKGNGSSTTDAEASSDAVENTTTNDREEKDNWVMEKVKNEINEVKKREEADKLTKKDPKPQQQQQQPRQKKRYTRANSEKLFTDIEDDIDDILNEGISEAELADLLGVNPSIAQTVLPVDPSKKDLDLKIIGNTPTAASTTNVTEDDKGTEEPETELLPFVNGTADVTAEPLSDLDFISSQSSQLSSSLANDKRKLRPARKQRTNANPMKSLQQRNDLIDEVVVADKQKEQKMNKMDLQSKFLRKNDLADEAVSALRATVDFSKTKLRKVEVNKKTMADAVLDESFVPSVVENLLIQIKGRRKCQTTLVEFTADSLNSNDCFVVCTPTSIMCWNGSQANVIERSKAAEVASRIQQKKEMGCKTLDVFHADQGSGNENKVLRLLGGGSVNLSAPLVIDEDFEKAMISAYMTYMVCETSDPPVLIPLDSQCHRMPTKEILQTDSAFVFDFITEVYVWLGRQTKSEQRRVVQKLAAEKFQEGYYKLMMSEKNPALARVTHTNTRHSRKISVQADAVPHLGRRGSKPQGGRRASVSQGRHQKREMEPRPAHSLLLQLFEGAEWVIFKEKFCDWPDESRIIRMKGGAGAVGEVTKEVSTEIQIETVDVTTMVAQQPLPKMVLDNMDIGRGRGIPKGMDGYHVITLDVKTWHVHENQSLLLPDESFGQFHSGEGYVIRWQYRIVKVRALRNCEDIMKAGGQERCCYFFWLGNDCSVNEEGATAVMTIELDREKGPQIRVVLGKEPPALLQLFDGSMIIHAGKRPVNGVRREYTDKSLIRLYCVRNEEEAEACLLQVPACCESLRSRTSFVLLLCEQGEVILWHGCKTSEGTRKAADHAVQNLIQNHPEEASIADKSEIGLMEIEEGDEPEVFWMALGGREEYGTLLDDPKDYTNLSPRLFQLESQTGQFVAHEIASPARSAVHNCPFPILQDDLYNVEQPAIFLVDAVETVYLWFGWWPDDEEGTEASNSRRRRWDEERRKAMESAVNYANEVGRSLEFMYAVYAGLEPEGFIELFPYWVVQEDITELQLDEGIEEDEILKITEELELFSKEFFTIEELREKPPPKGVDPTKLEKYLSDEDFFAVFKFSKEAYTKLPSWQQVNWKKKAGLY